MLSTLELTERFEDRREIKNVMGKYVESCLLCREDTLVDTLFSRRDDISIGFNHGYYANRQAVTEYYQAVCDGTMKVSKCLQKVFPQQLGNLSDEALYGVGPFKAEPLSSCYIQIAEDMQTAKAIWMTEGSITEVTTKGPITNWVWGYYCADFIKEDGQMKLWHVLRLEDTHCPNGVDWAMPENSYPELPEFGELAAVKLPAPTHPVKVYEHYSANRKTMTPQIPVPYKTFAETFSYGI